MTQKNILRGVGTAVAVAALAVAGVAISSGANSTSASNPGAPQSAAPNGAPPTGRPSFGTPATGAAATKAKAAALATYPGQVERIFKAPSGGYEVHVIKSDGSEVHVLVSADFKVMGTETGPPGGGRPATRRGITQTT